MDELLKKANIPGDGSMYIGELIGEPYLSDVIRPHYSLHVRPLFLGPRGVGGGFGEIVLATAERISVQVIGFEQFIPTDEAIRSGFWKPGDDSFMIRDTDLTPEQAELARYFIQPHTV